MLISLTTTSDLCCSSVVVLIGNEGNSKNRMAGIIYVLYTI